MRRGYFWAGYALILIMAGLGLREMWQARYDTNLLATRQRIGESMTQVQNLIDAVNSHVNMLRISAESILQPVDPAGFQTSPAYHQVLPEPTISGYCSEADEHPHRHPPVAISGSGALPAPTSALAREISMALLLNPQFAATATNIPNMAWAYYVSAGRFIALFPSVSCRRFHYTDDLLTREFFVGGTPAVDPARTTFWTGAYMDEAGKGLMASIGAPVYERDRFAGTVGINITLAMLSNFVTHESVGLGTAYIVNAAGQILAHPTLIEATDVQAHNIWEIFGPAKNQPMKILATDREDSFVDHGDRVVYSRTFQHAPWRYVYMSDRSGLVWQAFKDSKLEIIGFAMLATIIAAFERARLAGFRLRANVETLQAIQKDLQQARDRAEVAETAARKANRAKSIMLANASHDLRTPLNAIIGFSELMLTRMFGSFSPKYEEYLRDIHASGNLLLAIINDVLDLSKVEAGRYEMKEEEIDLVRFIESSSHLISTQAEKSGVDLRVHIQPDLPKFHADRRAMQQIMLNLLSNAIKFTPTGGKVEIRAGRAQNGDLKIEVEDTGKGITPLDQQVLFTPFSRGASARTANTQGTGLGLSIVKAMTELHGGSVELVSDVGLGTRVTLLFPRKRLDRGADDLAA